MTASSTRDLRVSRLGRAILEELKGGPLKIRDLARRLFPDVNRREDLRRYQSVFASLSRSVTRLEKENLVHRLYPERWGNHTRIRLNE